METTRVFDEIAKAYRDGYRGVDSRGGTRSTKTYSALQFLVFLAVALARKLVISVVSETLPHLKKGAIRDFEKILQDEGIISGALRDDPRWNATDHFFQFAQGTIIEFFSADSPGKVHGPSRDILFINEGQNIRWETANQLMIRTREFVIVDYNPTHEFWAHTELATDPRFKQIVSTYKDNRFLTPAQVEDIERGKKNANWWRVYGLGLTGQLEGVIYQFEQIDRMPDNAGLVRIGGLDYGFTNSKTAGVDILADVRRKRLYLDEMFYGGGMHNFDIIAALNAHGFPKKGPRLYADCAEPKANSEIKLAGFNVWPSDKGKEITYQISFIQGWEIYVTKTSTNIIHEFRNYLWDTDRDGNRLNHPIKEFDHAMDAFRYGVFGQLADFRPPKNTTVRTGKLKR
ncbi:PBSX family phage terminase large subunit [Succinimonas sp.]|uniref:PBSX family phage terminase large subunit n=1 Tax=Succinimonas sp. TaxID=1936151 RepID=UPI003864F718